MARKVEQLVIDGARLALLGWLRSDVDGRASMREAMVKLAAAFDLYDGKCHVCKGARHMGVGRYPDGRLAGYTPCPECGD